MEKSSSPAANSKSHDGLQVSARVGSRLTKFEKQETAYNPKGLWKQTQTSITAH